MRQAGDSRSVRSIHKYPNHRTVEKIKKNIVKQGKRRAIPWAFRPKKGKEAITGWRLSLNQILCVLEVRFVRSCKCCCVNLQFQIEFGRGEPVSISGSRHNVAESHPAAPDVHPRNSSSETVTSTASHGISGFRAASPQVPTEVANIDALDHETHRKATESIDCSSNPSHSVSPILLQVLASDCLPPLRPTSG